MQQGNGSNALQAIEDEGIAAQSCTDYKNNRELLRLAQGDDAKAAGDATEQLVKQNCGLVRSIVYRFRDRGVDSEDLMQIGTIGLLKAIRSFDLSRGTSFSTYAVPMIFGEIRKSLRDEGPIKVGRYYKKLGSEIMRLRNSVLQEEGREIRIQEAAERLGISAEEAAIAVDSMMPIGSLSDYIYGEEDGTLREDVIADPESAEYMRRFFERIALGESISKMCELWQKIVLLRYYGNKTQQQVAGRLGLSQVKVSREEKKIVEFLRKELQK